MSENLIDGLSVRNSDEDQRARLGGRRLEASADVEVPVLIPESIERTKDRPKQIIQNTNDLSLRRVSLDTGSGGRVKPPQKSSESTGFFGSLFEGIAVVYTFISILAFISANLSAASAAALASVTVMGVVVPIAAIPGLLALGVWGVRKLLNRQRKHKVI